MNWYKNLYVSEMIKKKEKKLIEQIENGKTPIGLYFIFFMESGQSQLEIIPAHNLRFWYKDENRPLVVGMAFGKQQAYELIRQMIEQAYRKTGNVNVRCLFDENDD